MKAALPIFTILLSFCLSAAGQTADSVKYKSLEPYDFHLSYLKDDKAVLIDVREFFEYKKSRIRDAINLPSSGNIDFVADTLDKDKSLYLYCTTGYRSKRISSKFAEKGFVKVYNLEGGIKAWRKEGLAVDKKRLKGTKTQVRKKV